MDIREEIIQSIQEEIVGPAKKPRYKDEVSGEEILLRKLHGSPKSRYGAGLLYPIASVNQEEQDTENSEHAFANSEYDTNSYKSVTKKGRSKEEDLDYEEPIGLANQFLPSAMGFTIRFNAQALDKSFELIIKSASYTKSNDQKIINKINSENNIEPIIVKKTNEPLTSDFWIRKPFKIDPINLHLESIFEGGEIKRTISLSKNEEGKSWLTLKIFDRTLKSEESDFRTITFTLVNDINASGNKAYDDSHILFQNEIILNTDSIDLIAPFKEKSTSIDTEEEEELNLLYRNKRIYAIGHGTSVTWEKTNYKPIGIESIGCIKSSVCPEFELPQVAPTSFVELSMFVLSDLGDWNEAKDSLHQLVSEYKSWIDENREIISNLEDKYQDAAKRSIQKCEQTLQRIEAGVENLSNNENRDLIKAFRWMNRAMLWQQQRSNVPQREWIRNRVGKTYIDEIENLKNGKNSFESLEEFHNSSSWGRWRPFQIAFVLMNIDSLINPNSSEREIVDLIWFPTGGGKTEAYLGLSALTIFFRRLKGEEEFNHDYYSGTTILMRYTLRLLTTQQYERASSLICACELIRKEQVEVNHSLELGELPISIGLWVGGSSTPNTNVLARTQFNKLNHKKEYRFAPYNFVVMKCPCCGSQIGKIKKAKSSDENKVKGIFKQDGKHGKVLFKCENHKCEFHNEILPLYVIDEHIYEYSPTLVLGTVDKFAMVPWKPEAGKLFGFRELNGERSRIKPPELIIQDELHLISGPLGSMVGLYEILILTLCNDYSKATAPFINSGADYVKPKVVASSATISRAKEQVKALYATEKLHIFPSHGLEFGETWFSTEMEISEKHPGRKYVGILASGYPSAQTAIVRSYSSVLQRVKSIESNFSDNIDYYWTLLGYFNSIRELGGAMSLVNGDIRERMSQIQNRELVRIENRRNLYSWKIQELTSRISSDKIPSTLKILEKNYSFVEGSKSNALDICLATNMLATGVDISRLGLMFIHGQPKTTAEYIQASSRVGRKVPEGPGLIFTIYSPSKPRDKSQYEQFYGYHNRIYSNVEPTSVTPYSINVRERGLHAILIALIRHFSSSANGLLTKASTENNEFDTLYEIFEEIILDSCKIVDPNEKVATQLMLRDRKDRWKKIGYQYYGDAGNYLVNKEKDIYPLMYASSSEVDEKVKLKSMATPTSLRGVDGESMLDIYNS